MVTFFLPTVDTFYVIFNCILIAEQVSIGSTTNDLLRSNERSIIEYIYTNASEL